VFYRKKKSGVVWTSGRRNKVTTVMPFKKDGPFGGGGVFVTGEERKGFKKCLEGKETKSSGVGKGDDEEGFFFEVPEFRLRGVSELKT